MEQWVTFYLTVWLMYSLSIGLTGWCLGEMARQERNWRSLIPGWNVVYLFQLAGRPAHEPLVVIVCFLVFPVLGVFLLVPLGGALMSRTGRKRILGLLFAFPPFGWLGLPIIALTAEHFSVPDPLHLRKKRVKSPHFSSARLFERRWF